MAQAQGMQGLAGLIKRLESATSRLEDVALIAQQAAASPAPFSPSRSTPQPLDANPTANSAPASSNSTQTSPAVKAYEDEIINGRLRNYVDKSEDAGPIVAEHASLVQSLCQNQLSFLQLASSCTKPASQQALLPLLSSTQEALQAVLAFKDNNNRSTEGRAAANQLSAVAEGVGAWGWVAVDLTPAPFVKDMKEAAQFYTNRVLKEYKDSDPKQVAWAKSWVDLLEALQAYVKQWHLTGVTWNPKGVDPASYAARDSSSAGAPPPPPPPPPPAPTFDNEKTSNGGAAPASGGVNAVMAQINKGEGVTSGLKKVDPSQQTHKNPTLRGHAAAPPADKAAPAKPSKPATLAAKPSKTVLEGSKWLVEYHDGNNQIVIDQTEINQTIHLYACKNSVLQVKGKVNAIQIVNCSKMSVVFDSVVSSLSITSSPSFTVQILDQAPTILIDTSDSGQIYLSKECQDSVEIITSKTSAINISIPTGEEGDFIERPVPEQMKTVVKNGNLVTTIVEHKG